MRTGPADTALCNRVSEALSPGYVLYGSPAATFDGERVILAQALVMMRLASADPQSGCALPAALSSPGDPTSPRCRRRPSMAAESAVGPARSMPRSARFIGWSPEPVRISICHCLACQRRTGSVFAVLRVGGGGNTPRHTGRGVCRPGLSDTGRLGLRVAKAPLGEAPSGGRAPVLSARRCER